LQQGYYYNVTNESPVAEVHRTMSDMRSCAYAILPNRLFAETPVVGPVELDYYSRLLIFPLSGGPRRIPSTSPNRELYAYLQAAFEPVQQLNINDLVLCKKRPASP
jgi:hypothetical protein